MNRTASDIPNCKESADYYDNVHRKTWVRRAAGFMGGATLFGAVGAIGGAIAAFMPYVFGTLGIAGAATVGLPTVAAVLSSIALFTAATGLLGMVIGADVGSNAGSVAAGLEEGDKRDIATNNISCSVTQHNEKPAKSGFTFNWKVGGMSAGLFAAFGALMAFNPITSSLVVSAIGFPAASAAAVTASATVMGMFGTTIGMPFGKYSNQLSNYYTDFITGKMRGESPEQQNAVMQPQASPLPHYDAALDEPQREARQFTASAQPFSLKRLIERNAENSTDKSVLVQR